MKNLNKILLIIPGALIFTGCSFKSINPFNNETVDTSQELKEVSLDSSFNEKIKYLETKYNDNNNELVKSRSKLLKNNADYMQNNIGHAIVENKDVDFPTAKPVFVEPIFAKVEIMPYETKDGIWHEQQSVWIKVKEGQIALKSNPFQNNTVVDQYKSILEK